MCGASTALIASNVSKRPGADVLVILAGTNDLTIGTTWAESRQNIERLVETVDARHVLVSAIPHYSAFSAQAADFNHKLEMLTRYHGWAFDDPWKVYRDGDQWIPGISVDGVHPGDSTYSAIGRTMRGLIASAATDDVVSAHAG